MTILKRVFRVKLLMNLSTKLALVLAISAGSAVTGSAMAQEYKKMTRIGTASSVCLGGIETADQLRDFFDKNPGAARDIVADSGWSGSADDLLNAIANGNLIERTYPIGSRFAWTSAKEQGQYVAKPYREWAGSAPFEAFQVNVSSGCQIHHIAIPKACCNVSLVSVSADNSAACKPPAPVAVAAPAPVVEPAPVKKALALIPFVGALVGSETRARFETSWSEDVRDTSGITGLQVGLIKEINSKTSIFGQVTYIDRNGINEGNVYPDSSFAVDIGIDRKLSKRIFIGGGIGAFNIDESEFRDASLFAHVGGDIGKSNFQWLVEGRVFDSDSETLDSINDNKLISFGIRYLIK